MVVTRRSEEDAGSEYQREHVHPVVVAVAVDVLAKVVLITGVAKGVSSH